MITFTIIVVFLAIAAVFLLAGLAVAATLFSGFALVVADIIIGVLPFILIFKLIKWLTRKRGGAADSKSA